MMGASLKGCDTTPKQNLRKGSTGEDINLIGKKIGSKTSTLISVVPLRKLRQISGLLMPQSCFGFANTKSPAGQLVRLVKSRNGGVSEKRIRCTEDEAIKAQDGKGGAPRNANPFIRHLSGPQSFRKYGNVIITNAKGAGYHTTECTFTISNPSQSKQNVQTLTTSSFSVRNATGLFIANAMLRGC